MFENVASVWALLSSSHLHLHLPVALKRDVCASTHPLVLVLFRCCSTCLIQAVLAVIVVTLIKFNYSQTSGSVEKNLEDGLLMS